MRICVSRKLRVLGEQQRYRACIWHLQCQFITVPQLPKMVFFFFFFCIKKENVYVRMSCGVCPQFLLWNIITILLSKALYFLGVFTDLQNVTASFFTSGSPRGTV